MISDLTLASDRTSLQAKTASLFRPCIMAKGLGWGGHPASFAIASDLLQLGFGRHGFTWPLAACNDPPSPHSAKTPADKSTGEMSSRGLVGPRLACRVLLYFLGLALFSRSEQLLSSLPRGHSSTVDKSSPSSINLECLRSDPAQLGSLPSGAGEAVNRPQLAALPNL